MSRIAMTSALALGLAVFGAASAAQAAPIVQNGSFSTTSATVSSQWGSAYPSVTVANWTSTGYSFIYLNPSDNAVGQYAPLTVGLINVTDSPDGGNFIAEDAAYNVGPISQTLTGLIPMDNYSVTFYYAGAQQSGKTGATTEGWQVSFGSETQDTAILNDASQSFTGWFSETFNFSATSSSEVLSFLALGGPSGTQPPMALLDGVSVTQNLPEPMTLSVFGAGVLGAAAWKRRRKAANDKKA